MSETVELDRASDPQAVRGYVFYDWGKSAFETSVTVAILPLWYAYLFLEANGLTTSVFGKLMTSDAIWAYSVSGAALMVALISPSLGVIADRRAIKMWWLRILTYVGAGGTVLIGFALLVDGYEWLWILVMFVVANVGLNGAGVFYNALLPHMGTDDEMDDISNKAFAFGYLGGGLLLLIHFGMVLSLSGDWVVPFCIASAGIWWYGFALLTFKWVPEPPIQNEMDAMGIMDSTRLALSEIKKTLSETNKFRTLFIYMLAYFFFIDGINTVTALGGVYGPVVLGLTATQLMTTILAVQFVAWPSALFFTILSNGGRVGFRNITLFTIKEGIGTKKALSVALAGWVFLCFAAVSFSPLVFDSHDDHEIMYEWDEDSQAYKVHINYDAHGIAQKLDYAASEFDEQSWATEYASVLPIELDDRTGTYDWVYGDSANKPAYFPVDSTMIQALISSIDDTRFSVSVSGGSLSGEDNVGIDHPTNLGDGPLDGYTMWVRDNLWANLGLDVGLQFLLLGCGMGMVLGGSQGLARSLFGQMVPETRSAEFFGFFGFFGKVAALIGPFLYATMTLMFDSRVGVLSIALLILIGALMMNLVDVEAGKADARAEDAKNRGID
ncbi:MAG TPA: MFS transporter [Candidatus Thalassarchaeaceae archaeon]|nr:MFS transporter [Candidatus Thalassarchaeaceae archaeon]